MALFGKDLNTWAEWAVEGIMAGMVLLAVLCVILGGGFNAIGVPVSVEVGTFIAIAAQMLVFKLILGLAFFAGIKGIQTYGTNFRPEAV